MPRVLVPLDESLQAEDALPWAATIARSAQLELHLLSVHRSPEEFWEFADLEPGTAVQQAVDSLPRYLDATAQSPLFKGLPVSTEVRVGDPAGEIVATAALGGTELVVIATRGKGGFTGAGDGSVADKLVRTLAVPIVVVPPGTIRQDVTGILVPLDGSAVAERALPLARRLAQSTGASLHLLRVVDLSGDWRIDAGQAEPLLDHLTRRSKEYLVRLAEEGERRATICGHPSKTIRDYARTNGCQLIVMATHGWSGPIRTELGSTADNVVRLSDRPVLLVRTA
jgi:nucleotide-binding universal stress UspA family protein